MMARRAACDEVAREPVSVSGARQSISSEGSRHQRPRASVNVNHALRQVLRHSGGCILLPSEIIQLIECVSAPHRLGLLAREAKLGVWRETEKALF
jgi:hypothetical protein